MIVLDASVVVALLVDPGPVGRWAEDLALGGGLLAPHLLHVEVANVLRRQVRTGHLSAEGGGLAHADLLALPVSLVPYEPCGRRVWELGANLTSYDAWYVAVAELFDAPVATLDRRLSQAPGPRCPFLTPPS